jgi:glycosyltransferase involved in cell wall biosynthesis
MPALERNPRVAFVLPAKNEEATIAEVIDGLSEIAVREGWRFQVIVADDSEDKTAAIASSLGARVVDGGRVGLGQAVMRGLTAALEFSPDWVFSLDCDGQVDVNELPQFLAAALREQADVVLSSRFLAGRQIEYAYPTVNWLGNRILVAILRLSTGFKFTDSHGGIRLMRASVLPGLKLLGRHTYVQETLVQMHRSGARIIELPSRWKRREVGESRVVHSVIRYGVRTLPALLYWLRLHYLALALAFILAVELAWSASLHPWSSPLLAALGGFLLLMSRLRLTALRISTRDSE